MLLRVLFSLINIGIFLALFVLYFVLTGYMDLVFYALLGWFVASFLLLRLPIMSRRVGGGPSASSAAPAAAPVGSSTGASGGGTPLPSSTTMPTSGVDAADIGFCPHCGTHVPPGTSVCPSCGRSTRIG
jgi:zinc-ribbon domain